jgi:alpha-D-xyloside xylohydrolase
MRIYRSIPLSRFYQELSFMSFASSKKFLLTTSALVLLFAFSTVRSGAQSIEHVANGAMVHTANGIVRIEVCSKSVIHIFASASPLPITSLVPAVIRPCDGGKFTTSSDNSTFRIQTSELKIEIAKDTGYVRFLASDGQPILSEQPEHGRTIAPEDVEGSRDGIRQEFLLSPGEALYGLGQHQEGFFNLRDIPVRLLQANTNISIPFLISTKGYGLLWNNAALTDFNPASEAIHLDASGAGTFQTGLEGEYGFLLSGNFRDKLRLLVDGKEVIGLRNMWLPGSASGKIRLAANTTYKVLAESGGDTKLSVRAPSDTMSFRSERGKAVDYYFIYGPEPSQVIAQYREFTGAAPLLPRWAYGFWQCRERYGSQQQILDTAAEFRKRKIPVDVLVQDWRYWGKYGWNAMRFDESDYPNPAEMMTSLHRQNLHLIISVWPKFGAETEVNREMAAAHLLLNSAATTGEPGESKESESWADLFNPKAQKAYWADINRNLFAAGLDGWWLDASEPEGDPLKSDQTFLGPGTTVRNAYPLFETSAVYDGQRAANPNKRVVILSRSAYTGQQRNGSISWSGDVSANWETLRRQIPAGLSFGMSGFPYWTTDIGGFFRPKDQYTSPEFHELLIRWFEYGAFCPIFRIHGYQSETEMWKYGPEVEQDLRLYDTLRYRLLPYIYSQAWDVTSRGGTIMRALPVEFPNDLKVREIGDQFMFGPSLLINPVAEKGARERDLWLPGSGNWVDFWTGQRHPGGESVKSAAPLSRIPIHVKEGSILVLGPQVQSAEEAVDTLEIRIYPGSDADFTLYEDQGDSYSYESGARAIIPMHWDDRRHTLTVGPTDGRFPNMPKQLTLRIVRVRAGYGIGVQPGENADRVVQFDGHRITVEVPNSRKEQSSVTLAH